MNPDRKLDFVIAGAARCGTTSLYTFLDAQPGVFLAKPLYPEPKFFSREDAYRKGIVWYLNTYFKNCTQELTAGEKSTEYFESKFFPLRAIKHFPALKVIIMLRDPVERTISNYWWSIKNGLEKRPLLQAIKEEMALHMTMPNTITGTMPNLYIARSFYAERLKNIFEHIPKKQILLIDFDEYIKSFDSAINKIAFFLNIEIRYFKVKTINNKAERKMLTVKNIYNQLQELFRDDIKAVNKKYNLSIKNGAVNL